MLWTTVNPSVKIAKRIVDVVGASLGLAVTLPLYPVIAAAIRLESTGPLIFRQKRAGRLRGAGNGRRYRFDEFQMFKFRTMRPDAERETGPIMAGIDDPRITRVGRFLRKTRLDEIPQLWNVLKGDMSLVGPRPERPELLVNLALAIPFFEERMRDVKPGITGLAQISLGYSGRPDADSVINQYREVLTNPFKVAEAEGADADDMRMKLLYDFAYGASLEHFVTFLRTELYVIAKTPWVMLKGIGR
jgi:lipopolysaccharide/colanic/teichoic acid biosynthesis glycosyltransferase